MNIKKKLKHLQKQIDEIKEGMWIVSEPHPGFKTTEWHSKTMRFVDHSCVGTLSGENINKPDQIKVFEWPVFKKPVEKPFKNIYRNEDLIYTTEHETHQNAMNDKRGAIKHGEEIYVFDKTIKEVIL